MNKEKFIKVFNKSFWRIFKNNNLFYKDLNSSEKRKLLLELSDNIEKSIYYPSRPIGYILKEKGFGVSRMIPILEIKDYCVYYYCTQILQKYIAVNRVENTYGGWSLGGKIRELENIEINSIEEEQHSFEDAMIDFLGLSFNPEYSFNPGGWVDAYGDFNSKLKINLYSDNFEYAVLLDIANFYDNIKLDILERHIREITDKDDTEEISLLFHFLKYWNRDINFYNPKTVGLPQDLFADCSRILANFYLQEYDFFMKSACGQRGLKYFRYCDDQIILGNDKGLIKEVVFLASRKLNSIGLNINQKKVKFQTIKELLLYKCFDLFDLISGENKNNIQNIINVLNTYIELNNLRDIKKVHNNGYSILKKVLNSNLDGLSEELKKELYNIVTQRDFLINLNSYYFYRIYKLYDEEEEFINIIKELINQEIHNYFHYEAIKFFNNIGIDNSYILERIKNIEKLYTNVK